MLLTLLGGKTTKQQQELMVSWLQMGYVHREKPFDGKFQSIIELSKVDKRELLKVVFAGEYIDRDVKFQLLD